MLDQRRVEAIFEKTASLAHRAGALLDRFSGPPPGHLKELLKSDRSLLLAAARGAVVPAGLGAAVNTAIRRAEAYPLSGSSPDDLRDLADMTDIRNMLFATGGVNAARHALQARRANVRGEQAKKYLMNTGLAIGGAGLLAGAGAGAGVHSLATRRNRND